MLIRRKLLDKIKPFYSTRDIIVVHGARQTGKTSLLQLIMAELSAENCRYFDLEDSRIKEIMDQGADSFNTYLKQKGMLNADSLNYILLDEVQYLDNPSSFLKLIHDHYPDIKLIVSGSSSFEIKSKFRDTLVGRTVNFELFTLDFEEFLLFKNQSYDLAKYPDSDHIHAELKNWYFEYVMFGSYPKIVLTDNIEMKARYIQQIIDTYIKGDIRDLARIKYLEKFNKLVQILAGQSGQLYNGTEISNTTGLARGTLNDYLFLLEQTYILKKVTPWYKNLRSELFKTPKIFFYDTGLMHLLSQKNLPRIVDGISFEAAFFSELVKNFEKENIQYWRTQDKKEIDFILTMKNNFLPIEVKLNAFRFNFTPMKYFNQKYNPKSLYCISLEGALATNGLNIKQVYPWYIYSGEFMEN